MRSHCRCCILHLYLLLLWNSKVGVHCHLIGGADAGVTPIHADPKRRSDHSGGGSARTNRRTTDAPSAAATLIGRVVVLFLVPGGLVILLSRRLPLLLVAGRGQTGGFASLNVR